MRHTAPMTGAACTSVNDQPQTCTCKEKKISRTPPHVSQSISCTQMAEVNVEDYFKDGIINGDL